MELRHLRFAAAVASTLQSGRAADLLTEPLQIRDGELGVRPGPGLGVEIAPDKLPHYRTDT
ncbi:hypothetical protein [Georgenia thermotolerans]|uniref:Uncharacterized protein n=1 Tax=Georgenia thermotolerans TaxID=527326 RepID=A0A7J5UPF9_9MICO|nr:hypothetical protein [Georgenia thermotolerans]KAE8763994.1 hypothetical protein GB883_11300 [Georgenia thermotolerans]